MYTRAILSLALGAFASHCSPLMAESLGAANGSRLRVRVYNLANIHKRTLDTALDEAARILAATGVSAVWEPGETGAGEARTLDMSADNIADDHPPDERGFLVLRIVPRTPATFVPGALGFALPSARYGVHVTIFYDRIENVAEKVAPGIAKILGNAVAHELGHVLLGSAQHSRNGVMKAVWGRADYQQLAIRPLEFLPDEAVRVHEAVSRRAAVLIPSRQD